MQENTILRFEPISVLQIHCSSTNRVGLSYGFAAMTKRNNAGICKNETFLKMQKFWVVKKKFTLLWASE